MRRAAWGGTALLARAVALVSYRYLLGRGPVPDAIAANRRFDLWIVVHAGCAATALLVGPAQFLPGLRHPPPRVQRIVGRTYVTGCAVGGGAALVLATGVSSGPFAGLGFGALGAAWLATTAVAVREVLAGRVSSHRAWMVRFFALALSAVTLRIYLPASGLLGVDHDLAYPAVAWLCWLPNAAVAEIYLAGRPAASA